MADMPLEVPAVMKFMAHSIELKLNFADNGSSGSSRSAPSTLFQSMSQDQFKAFQEAVQADPGLQEKLNAAVDADVVVAIAKAAGFVISIDDLHRLQAEVSEDELEGVAGGLQLA